MKYFFFFIDTPKKPVITEAERKNPNLRLTPNKKVKVWDRDPLLDSM